MSPTKKKGALYFHQIFVDSINNDFYQLLVSDN
jgi:hypothetical protein